MIFSLSVFILLCSLSHYHIQNRNLQMLPDYYLAFVIVNIILSVIVIIQVIFVAISFHICHA